MTEIPWDVDANMITEENLQLELIALIGEPPIPELKHIMGLLGNAGYKFDKRNRNPMPKNGTCPLRNVQELVSFRKSVLVRDGGFEFPTPHYIWIGWHSDGLCVSMSWCKTFEEQELMREAADLIAEKYLLAKKYVPKLMAEVTVR